MTEANKYKIKNEHWKKEEEMEKKREKGYENVIEASTMK